MSHIDNSNSIKKVSDGIDLPKVAKLLLARKWFILVVTFGFVVLGGLYSILAAPRYQADMLVQIEQPARANPLSDVSTLLGKQPPSQAEIEIVRSRMVLGSAVDFLQLDVYVKPSIFPVIGGFLNRVGVARPTFMQDWRYVWANESVSVLKMIVAEAYLRKEFKLKVIDGQTYGIIFEDQEIGTGNAGASSQFLGGKLVLEVAEINAPAGAVFYLSRQPRLLAISNLKKKLSVSERGQETGILSWSLVGSDPELTTKILSAIGDIYVAQNIRHRSEETRQSLEFLEDQLPKVRAELARAEDMLNAYRIDKDSLDLPLETRSVLDRLVNLELQINELELNEAEISQRFTPTHPTYAALLDKKVQLKSDKQKIEGKIESLPETQQQILRLQRDAAVNQQIYVQLRNKVQEMQIAEASTIGNVRILDMAESSPRPVYPVKKLVLVYSVIFGLMCSISFVMIHGLVKSGIATIEELESMGLSAWATVPLFKKTKKMYDRDKKSIGGQSLLAKHDTTNNAIEALRALRTSLYFTLKDSPNKCLMITSATPSAGKSFISANLAAVCAQAGQRVLLVDADLRKGIVHSYLDRPACDGLSEALNGAEIESLIYPDDKIDNLFYLSRGAILPSPSERLAKPTFAEILAFVDQRFDLVLIDTPPVLAVTDAAIIGRQVGATLLVVRCQENTLQEIALTKHRLQLAGVSIAGAVLNGLAPITAADYGYGNYGYQVSENLKMAKAKEKLV